MNKRRTFLEEDQDQDRFLESVNRGLDFAKQRAVPLTFVGVAAVLVILLTVWLVNQRADAGVAAYVDMHEALAAYQAAGQATAETRASELTAVIARLAAMDGGPHEAQARYTQGRALLDNGSASQAATVFKANATAGAGAFGLYSQLGYASALAAQENWSGAASAYSDASLAPYQDVPGYDAAWTQAALARAQVARRDVRPADATRAYEAVSARYEQAREAAMEARGAELVNDASMFLAIGPTPGPAPADLASARSAVEAWVNATLAKPQADRVGLTDGLRLQRTIETHFESRAAFAVAQAEGAEESSSYLYRDALGDATVSPSLGDHQRAQLELSRLAAMTTASQ